MPKGHGIPPRVAQGKSHLPRQAGAGDQIARIRRGAHWWTLFQALGESTPRDQPGSQSRNKKPATREVHAAPFCRSAVEDKPDIGRFKKAQAGADACVIRAARYSGN